MGALPLTGERTVPGVAHENYWFMRHLVAYEFAAARAAGLRVLDAGSGEGYGTRLLADAAADAVGVELVADVVAHARRAYPDVEFLQADLCDLPVPAGSVDLVVSLQVIEHLPDIGRYLAEIARVLVPGGTFICATPNRLTFTPGSDTPVNPFHVKEFSAQELRETLSARFDVCAVLGVRHGARLRTIERVSGARFPDLVLARPPQDWPWWLRRAVAAVRSRDFAITHRRVDGSLDLIAVATTPS